MRQCSCEIETSSLHNNASHWSVATSGGLTDGVRRVRKKARRDLTGYILEYAQPLSRGLGWLLRSPRQQLDSAWLQVKQAVDEHAVVVFEKKGCPFCQQAWDLLEDHRVEHFAMTATSAPIRNTLKRELRLPLLTYPQIFVKGNYVGGFDQLQESIDRGHFKLLLEEPHRPFPEGTMHVLDPMKLLIGPRGQPWYCFQLHVYANYIRLISAVHVALFAGIIALADTNPGLGIILLRLFAVDMIIFMLMGPAPIAPLSTIVSAVVWRFRGPGVTSLPYKAVMGVAYLSGLAPALLCDGSSADCAKELKSSTAVLSWLLVNSAMLAAFRF